ncbi:DUF6316 family protein [Agaribacterium haliotis]|uniref:DUF6316 family protein n=1 Tax=Agaribacterium haliotis TaxID=2013869 RepID=UPI000BB547FB|nr:DUF6316 family protein [Agaribacterium haliotis]
MSKLQLRAGEAEKTWFRSERFFNVDRDVYFSTREGRDVGPFPSRAAAARGLDLYIQTMQKEKEDSVYAARVAMQGLWASTMFH